MANINKLLQDTTPRRFINKAYEDEYKPRNYLGLSQIGHKCQRYLWYCYNGCLQDSIPDGRLLRLFELGNQIENIIINDLTKSGYRVYGEQKEVLIEHNGLILKGHIDGMIDKLQESKKIHLLEVKSSNEKRFNQLIKLNSYEEWAEGYKAQVHVYMLGLKLDRCLVVVYNKNTAALYTERITLNKGYIVKLLQKVFDTIAKKEVPERLCPRADWWEAKFCNFCETCFKK